MSLTNRPHHHLNRMAPLIGMWSTTNFPCCVSEPASLLLFSPGLMPARTFRASQCRGDQHLADRQRCNQKSGKRLARHYVIDGECLTHWRVLLRVFFRSDLEHG